MSTPLPSFSRKVDWALWAARQGFFVHPLKDPGDPKVVNNPKLLKTPAFDDWQELATRDAKRIRLWWAQNPNYNIGYSTSKFGEGDESLVVVDIDVKGTSNGFETARRLEAEGKTLPSTYTQTTPSGGAHFIYRSAPGLRPSQRDLGPGINTRAWGGNLVGAGSVISGKAYSLRGGDLLHVPPWILEVLTGSERLSGVSEKAQDPAPHIRIDEKDAKAQAAHYLKVDAPIAVSGSGGNATTYKVAARVVKDFGVSVADAAILIATLWNVRCEPPWELDELNAIVRNANDYAQNAPGIAAPEKHFQAVVDDKKGPTPRDKEAELREKSKNALHPFQVLNRDFAFVLAGGGHHVLWETTDVHGAFTLVHLPENSFHKMLAAQKLALGDGKLKPTTELWMESPERRSYKGVVFRPGLEVEKHWYNMWRGFKVTPQKEGEATHESVHAFLEHAQKNICDGDENLFRWLIGYFAHLVQKPYDKPLTALVLRGPKGVGKNFLVDTIGHLLGCHYLLTDDRRFLVSNFNAHFENCLLFCLDEAFWSGDKEAEGKLKGLITGKTHNVEFKGKEVYPVDNVTRVIILGNEEWLVPASHDERRYAVFNVGSGRKKDIPFFRAARAGLEAGGYESLLRYLLDYDLKGIELNEAPATKGLHDQKIESLAPFQQWWYQNLLEGHLSHGNFNGGWPTTVRKDRFRDAFYAYMRSRNVRGWAPDDRQVGKLLSACCSLVRPKRIREGEDLVWGYAIPELDRCRVLWDKFIGHPIEWPKLEI